MSNTKQDKKVKFQDTLTFNKTIHYSTELDFDDFAKNSKETNPEWDDEFIKQVWMELCEEGDWRGNIDYEHGESVEIWDEEDFKDIFAECYLDDAVEKVNAKLKKD